ncbi:MAG: hypothetical protein U0354_00065 [Candidatus Sericytochromatia bacterium]
MASNRKKVEQPAYNDPGWGDSISVSKKARQELAENAEAQESENKQLTEAKGTATLKQYTNYSKPNVKKTPQKSTTSEYSEMSQQVDQINQEINKAVTEIEGVLERFLNQLMSAINNFFLAFYSLFLKFLLIVFVQPLKNAGKLSSEIINMMNKSLEDLNTWLSGGKSQNNQVRNRKPTTRLEQEFESNIPVQKVDSEAERKRKYPAVFDGIRFGELATQGIVFLNIKNSPMYDVNKKDFSIEEEQEMLDNAVREINNCAKLAKSLPSPTKGRYLNKPMLEILENARMEDLKAFLQYVYTHPKPFVERQLRLSEAFATWAHKGAPV